MNGDMPHVPITTLAGIASLTDLLNQLPLPSPLPATTTKSLLYNGRIAEEVNCLLGCRDENLASQLAHGLNQVSTEHIELKDNLGSDEPEGDAPLLLQTMLARNPGIFREKNVMQQSMVQQYKITQNSMHSPAPSANFQPAAISPNPSSRFVAPQTGSSSRYMGQQNSPVPSPYTPQSPAPGYIQQYPHQQPPSYNQHQQIQQVSVPSPMVPGSIRNIHEGKVSGQMANTANHHSDRHGTDDYLNIVHRSGSEDGDSSLRNPAFPLRSPQSGCSPAAGEGTPKQGSRPPLILQSPPPYVLSPREGGPDQKQQLQQRKKIPTVKEEKDMYDIVSSPNKDSTKLTLKLSRVKSNESDPPGDAVSGLDHNSDNIEAEMSFQQVPVLQQNLIARHQQVPQQAGGAVGLQPPSSPYDEVELDALAEIERIEREAASEKCSKEVQDKDKPLKKRKQDSFPLDPGAGGPGGPTGAPGSGPTGGGNAGKLTPQEATAAGNGASRPPLMVSIDLQQAGRADGQPDPCLAAPVPALEAQRWPEEPSCVPAAVEGSDTASRLKPDGRPDVIKNRVDKHDGRRDCRELSKHRHDDKPSDRRAETPKSSGRGEHGRDRESDKDRRHRSETGDARLRCDRDRSGFRASSVGEPGRSSHRQDSLKPSAVSSGPKLPDSFPAHLLGGQSGALKNFQIPKIKRDGGVPIESHIWGQPKVKLERLGLVQDFEKRPKPVVLLKKLSVDQIQRIIRHSKSGKNRFSSGKYGKSGMDPAILKELPPELLAEIESTMPLCERVKMNKRKRSTINEKPKYAEVSSDDDANEESARKRQRREKDRAWDFEERERRTSGEHRRSGSKEGRRGSGSRYRDSSEDDSPPPSLSDVARKLKMKEKQKKRKAYEPKLTQEELMDSSTFKRFLTSIDNILENLEDVDFTTMADDDEIPQELLLGKHQLNELGSESAKIKAMGITGRIPSDKLVKLLNILEKNIQDGAKLSTMINHDHDGEDEERLWRDLIMERVTKSADACLTALNIMTSAHMPKAVYIEDVIERVLQYTKFHLQNTLYPQYDPVYKVDPHGGGLLSSKAKRAKCSTHKQRVIIMLYNKVCDVVSNISELLEIQLLTDTTILQVSSMGITPFFVENVSELQLCAIKLVTAVFSRYEKHRQLILEEIFTSLARLPTSKRSLRNFRLNSSDQDGEPMYIQMVTALVLQLIQCVVHLPNDRDALEEHDSKVDQDVLITNSYETAMRTAQNFLSVFLKKCGSKQGEEDYRPLFENFVQDLLSTVNKPEWPAAELLLSLLGRLLVHQFSNKQTEMALRVASLDYLGTVAARLRKDAVTSRMDQRSIDRILEQSQGSDETQQLQKALLDYLEENADTDASLVFARKFYIAQWFRDATTEAEKSMRNQNPKDDDSSEGPQHAKEMETTGEIMQRAEKRKKFLRNIIKTTPAHFATLKMNSDTVDYEDSCLIVRYLASMRPFAQSFDIYLTQILRVLGESAIAVRTKAMKCLSEVVAVDPSILARSDMQRGVHGRLMDNSTSVREAAVELLGKFVLSRPQLTEQYYDMLIERILDTGISVRKRVIKILRDICLEQPTFSKITEMCVRMIRRVNDEEGIKKLVNETFQKLWFTPTPAHDKETMTRKILNITDVVAACRDTGYDWFEQLLSNLLKSEEDASYKPAKKACVQLVDNLVEHILKYEESLAESKGVNSTRLVACITTLYLFSKIRAQLMVKHAMTMQPYLTTKCNTANDFMVICNVAKMLELVVPLMEHPSETFLATIEEDLMKLIIKYGMTVVQHCVSCLGAVVNKVTHNYKFVWACFNKFYCALNKLKAQHQEDPNSTTLIANKPILLRALFTVGALGRHFDFDLEEFKGSTKIIIKEKVLELLLYFTKHEDEKVKTKAIIGLGFLVIMHPSQMFMPEVKSLYNGILADSASSINLKIQILKNLQTYLQEEDTRMQEADREWKKLSKQEDLKEMGDISSGMSSSIMQLYLKQVLEAFFHTQSSVRHFALNVIALTLNQGLIHPVQCVPYLIAMGTDPEPSMRNKADQQLVEIDKKYTGFIHMKAVAGMKMSFNLQQSIEMSRRTIIRGFRQDETHSALCSHLFSMIRTNRQHRRAFLISLLNLFDDSARTEVNMLLFIADNLACFPYQSQEEPLFIMHHIDICLSVSGSNLLQNFTELLLKEPRRKEKKVKEWKSRSDGEDDEEKMNCESPGSVEERNSEDDEVVRQPKKTRKPVDDSESSESDSDLDDLSVDDTDRVMKRLPDNPASLLDFANSVQGILLLLVLKQHLKNQYGFSDGKIQKYSPTESAKVYDKAVNRKINVYFNPRQTLDFISNNMARATVTEDVKRRIVKQYLDFKILMEHLDPDEEDEEGEASASANIRNKAINALLGSSGPLMGPSPRNQAGPETDDDYSDGDERAPGSSRKTRRSGDPSDPGRMNETVEVMDVIALCCPKYKDRPQIARVVHKTTSGYAIHWMAGSYSGPWAEAKKRDGRKLVPWVDTIKESDVIFKKIALTSNHKLSNKVVQTLRSLYAAREGGAS
ncbi:nipped-B-like protein A isoform X1 [Corythoichthys intestinalis]|uniref:nipped-B-like protein A isoform X1 n=1 Tax=Corythoichthys intestinalis TaxID=161448 RepID=UPI0025A667DA|nr:nipped-B-like protein A isoform X1 [Corythoichthys intestinalis]XP_057687451.1 nipped-B-like protein A isoform X1 [Corythoichthys intestinalis]